MNIIFEDIKNEIKKSISQAKSELKIAVSWLTDISIFNILLDKLSQGVNITLITRNDYLNNHPNALDWNLFILKGGKLYFCQPGDMLHYKFCIIDDQLVLMTSQNWTCFAGNNNRENLILDSTMDTIKSFNQEIEYLTNKFQLQTEVERIQLESINPLLHGFYQLTLIDDAKYQIGEGIV